MKNLISTVLLMFVLTIVHAQENDMRDINFQLIGQNHNKGLDEIYKFVRSQKLENVDFDVISEGAILFLKNNEFTTEYADKIRETLYENTEFFLDENNEKMIDKIVENLSNENA